MAAERLLVLGGTGMLGHRVVIEARRRTETWWTARRAPAAARRLLGDERLVDGVDASEPGGAAEVLERVRPTVVLNCAGLVKQRAEASDPAASIAVNALFPHRLATACRRSGARLVHVSTDCVFSGRGRRPLGYSEADPADPTDLYGRTKLAGEVGDPCPTGDTGTGPACLTLRTSMVGRELARSSGLLEWLLGAGPEVAGHTASRFSGLATPTLARVLVDVALDRPDLEGTWHLASEPITKFELVSLLTVAFADRAPLWAAAPSAAAPSAAAPSAAAPSTAAPSEAGPVRVRPEPGPAIDRALDGRRLAGATDLRLPSWVEMATELAADRVPYDELRALR